MFDKFITIFAVALAFVWWLPRQLLSTVERSVLLEIDLARLLLRFDLSVYSSLASDQRVHSVMCSSAIYYRPKCVRCRLSLTKVNGTFLESQSIRKLEGFRRMHLRDFIKFFLPERFRETGLMQCRR